MLQVLAGKHQTQNSQLVPQKVLSMWFYHSTLTSCAVPLRVSNSMSLCFVDGSLCQTLAHFVLSLSFSRSVSLCFVAVFLTLCLTLFCRCLSHALSHFVDGSLGHLLSALVCDDNSTGIQLVCGRLWRKSQIEQQSSRLRDVYLTGVNQQYCTPSGWTPSHTSADS